MAQQGMIFGSMPIDQVEQVKQQIKNERNQQLLAQSQLTPLQQISYLQTKSLEDIGDSFRGLLGIEDERITKAREAQENQIDFINTVSNYEAQAKESGLDPDTTLYNEGLYQLIKNKFPIRATQFQKYRFDNRDTTRQNDDIYDVKKLFNKTFNEYQEDFLEIIKDLENQKYDFKDITVIEAGRSPTQDASFYHYLADKALQLNTTHSIAKAKEYRDMAELIESKDNTIGSLVKKYLFNRHQNKQKSGIDMQQQDGDSQKDGDGDVKERNLEQELLLGDLVNKVTERIKTSTTLQGTDILIAAKNELARYGIDASYMLAGLATEEEKEKLKKGDNFATFLRQDALTTEIIDEKNTVQLIFNILRKDEITSADTDILKRQFAKLFSSRSRSKYDTETFNPTNNQNILDRSLGFISQLLIGKVAQQNKNALIKVMASYENFHNEKVDLIKDVNIAYGKQLIGELAEEKVNSFMDKGEKNSPFYFKDSFNNIGKTEINSPYQENEIPDEDIMEKK